MKELVKFKKPEDNLDLPELQEVRYNSVVMHVVIVFFITAISCSFIGMTINLLNYIDPRTTGIVIIAIFSALIIYVWYRAFTDALGYSINKDGIKIRRILDSHFISWSNIRRVKLHTTEVAPIAVTLYTLNNKKHRIDDRFSGIASIWMHTYKTLGKSLFDLPKKTLIYWSEITDEVPDEYVWEMSKKNIFKSNVFYSLMAVGYIFIGIFIELDPSSKHTFPFTFSFFSLFAVILIVFNQNYTAKKIIINNDFMKIFYSYRSVKLDWNEIKSIDYYAFIKTKNITYRLGIDTNLTDEGQDMLMVAIIKKAKAKHINYCISSSRFLNIINKDIEKQISR